jgi:S1-C subfamily serine protease
MLESASARETAYEALRILRRVSATFSNNATKNASGFVGPEPGTVLTCAHVVSERGLQLSKVSVSGKPAQVEGVLGDIDLAILSADEREVSETGSMGSLKVGDPLMFAGYPTGVAGPSVFSGILSAQGEGLVDFPRCRLLQVNGMINAGNSGGPLFKVGSKSVVGIITAKYVPLLREIENLRSILRSIPQFPSEVAVGQVDFSKFVNLTVHALRSVSGSLLLVQVGTGYAVPIELWRH